MSTEESRNAGQIYIFTVNINASSLALWTYKDLRNLGLSKLEDTSRKTIHYRAIHINTITCTHYAIKNVCLGHWHRKEETHKGKRKRIIKLSKKHMSCHVCLSR